MSNTSFETQNPTLAPLFFLVGHWNVTMSHVAIPEPLSWQDSFGWLEGAFILWHWQGKGEVPRSTSIISRNGQKPEGEFAMFYYDARGVSRVFGMRLTGKVWSFWREDADFFQRFSGTLSDDGRTIQGHGEIATDGKTWVHDYDITYTKIETDA
jgi:hypothetical protein